MKIYNIAALVGIGIIVTFGLICIYFENPDPNNWVRGDKLEAVNISTEERAALIGNCDIIFISDVATSDANVVFVLLDCGAPINKSHANMFKREYLRKKIK